jgi:DegV family protein with EDD domain
VVAAAQALRADLKTWFAVDTLEFLRRGGRIGAAQAYLGSALKIKPILTLGKEIEPVERVRTAGRAVARMKEYLEQRREEGADRFAVQHIRDPERAQELAEAGRALYGTDPLFISEVGPVIGTHVGPGLLGVTGVRSELVAPG